MNRFFEHFCLVATSKCGHEIGGEILEMSDEVEDSIFKEMIASIKHFYQTEHSQCSFQYYAGKIDCREIEDIGEQEFTSISIRRI